MNSASVTAAMLLSLTLYVGTTYGFQSEDSVVSTPQVAVEVQSADGGVFSATISAISENGIELMVDSSALSLDFKQIASLSCVQPVASPETNVFEDSTGTVSFVDGSTAMFSAVQIIGDTATVVTVAKTSIEASVSNLKAISFLGVEATEDEKTQWTELLSQPLLTSDAIVVSRNGKLQLIEGVVGNISDQSLTFSMETRTADVALEKIRGVLFYRAQRELTDPLCRLLLTDGSSFAVREIEINNDGFLFTSVAGTQFSAPSDHLQRMDFSVGRFVYLSDLIPSTNTWTPLLASSEILEPLRKLRVAKFNRDFRGQPLAVKAIPPTGLTYLSETMTYEKGIAISGGGRVVFAVNGQFKKLTGLVGFDPAAFVGGEVRFVIKTDGQTAISEVMRSAEVLQPIALDLDIAGTKRVAISVEYEDGKLAGDILHLVDFKLLR